MFRWLILLLCGVTITTKGGGITVDMRRLKEKHPELAEKLVDNLINDLKTNHEVTVNGNKV